jgi:hypothetical protein
MYVASNPGVMVEVLGLDRELISEDIACYFNYPTLHGARRREGAKLLVP